MSRQFYYKDKAAPSPQTTWFVILVFVVISLFTYIGFNRLVSPEANAENSSSTLINENSEFTATPSAKIIRVGIQAGHWKNEEIPDELSKLYWSGGATVGSVEEWAENLLIAKKVAALLKAKGVTVDLLPATVPENYQADLFIALHLDGNDVTSVSGYKIVSSEFDQTGEAELASQMISTSYKEATNFIQDPNITEDMTEYYAFNYIKYLHSISEATPGVILEMGYLTNFNDRQFILSEPDTVAAGIASGILQFLGLK